jgi:hypothetical protein
MTSHFKFYEQGEVVIPWSAQYDFPTMANKAIKTTPRIPPKNGGEFRPGNVIRLEFPAQGYVNPNNTTLSFDLTLFGYTAPQASFIRMQNNIQSIFQRGRILYGPTPLEDIINYNVIARMLTEWTTTTGQTVLDQTTISEGLGGTYNAYTDANAGVLSVPIAAGANVDLFVNHGTLHTRQAIQGQGTFVRNGITYGLGAAPNNKNASQRQPLSGQATCANHYSINFLFGLFSQSKLIPTKYMASQLAIELTLAPPEECIFVTPFGSAATSGTLYTAPSSDSDVTYVVSNVNLIPEILEFDTSYDMMFLKGLNEGGVPIKFASWHSYQASTQGSSTLNIAIQERSRSVKSLYTVVRRAVPKLQWDSGALFYTSSGNDKAAQGATGPKNTLLSYQYRIGGKYFPASPVQCASPSGDYPAGAEPFVELQKALNTLGDYRLSAPVNFLRWAQPFAMSFKEMTLPYPYPSDGGAATYGTTVNEGDCNFQCTAWSDFGTMGKGQGTIFQPVGGASGNVGSTCFVMAIDLETTNGLEVSGLNAQEMSDISLLAYYSGQQGSTFVTETYAYYDSMLVLQPNNNIELIY